MNSTEYNGNILYGKKWAVCGDSFTSGVTGSVFEDGFCKGMPKTYPYFIAERNLMEIVRFFEGGRCLGYPADNTFHNSLTDPTQEFYYRSIPSDADYITIYLGINDSIMSTAKPKTAKIRPVRFPSAQWTIRQLPPIAAHGMRCFPG